MAERENQLEKNIMEYSMQFLEEHKQQMSDVLENRQQDIVKDVLWAFHKLFLKAAEEQKEIAYIVISFLNTGILSDSIELKISLYDRDLLFDKVAITDYYEFHFFDEIIKRDIESFHKYIQKKMIRVKYQELWRYRRVCMIKYKSAMEECMQGLMDMMVRLKSYKSMNKAPDIKIMFGELLCKNTVLYEEPGEGL